jgi:hypothetical protein
MASQESGEHKGGFACVVETVKLLLESGGDVTVADATSW